MMSKSVCLHRIHGNRQTLYSACMITITCNACTLLEYFAIISWLFSIHTLLPNVADELSWLFQYWKVNTFFVCVERMGVVCVCGAVSIQTLWGTMSLLWLRHVSVHLSSTVLWSLWIWDWRASRSLCCGRVSLSEEGGMETKVNVSVLPLVGVSQFIWQCCILCVRTKSERVLDWFIKGFAFSLFCLR